jgi:ApaG protein
MIELEPTDHALRIHAVPLFLPEQSSVAQGLYSFAYTITIQNMGLMAVQLLRRHWVIEDGNGRIEHVRGDGVVGQQPRLKPGESFEYTSGCRLPTPAGMMHGEYSFVDDAGAAFDWPIPAFVLSKNAAQPH